MAAAGDARLRPLPGTTKNSFSPTAPPSPAIAHFCYCTLLLLHRCTLTLYTPTPTHPHQTDTSAPWDKNASKRFHPLQAQILKRTIYTDLFSGYARTLTFQDFSLRACRSHTCSSTVLTSSTRTRQISAVFLTPTSFLITTGLIAYFGLALTVCALPSGYIGQDIVQLGHYYARTKFGCITRCDSADFNGVWGKKGAKIK